MSDEKRDGSSKALKHHSSDLKHRSSRKRASRGELDFIERIKGRALESHDTVQNLNSSLITHHSSLLKGIGDDAAVIKQSAGHDLVITTDLLVEEVDFRREWTEPRLLGHKALAVSLSDITAMGARPLYALLSVGVPQKIWDTDFVDEFYKGFLALARQHRVKLIGGDLSRTPERIVIDSIVLGETLRGRAVLRSGARPGDSIFVTGSLGGAAAGLEQLKNGARFSSQKARTRKERARQQLLERQLRPDPRNAWGAWLGEKRLATAMIDVSDGLSSDLLHLCEESGVGAALDAARIPLDEALKQTGALNLNPLSLALDGGEDFELLFTVSPRNLKRLPRELDGVNVTDIGEVTDAAHGIKLRMGGRVSSLRAAGFQHFKRTRS